MNIIHNPPHGFLYKAVFYSEFRVWSVFFLMAVFCIMLHDIWSHYNEILFQWGHYSLHHSNLLVNVKLSHWLTILICLDEEVSSCKQAINTIVLLINSIMISYSTRLRRRKSDFFMTQEWLTLNILMPSQNGRHFANGYFRFVFLDENCILIQISLQFVPNGQTNNKPAQLISMLWDSLLSFKILFLLT